MTFYVLKYCGLSFKRFRSLRKSLFNRDVNFASLANVTFVRRRTRHRYSQFEYLFQIEKHWITACSRLLSLRISFQYRWKHLPLPMPLAPSMCPRAIKAERRGIYVKMSISTTGAQFPWTRKCIVSRRDAEKNSQHLHRTRSFNRAFFSKAKSRPAKVEIACEINMHTK